VGAGLGIAAITVVSYGVLSGSAAALMVASMGASAVLLFAVPHGTLSQPWAVCGGHGLSALVGVSVYLWMGDAMLAPAVAVGLAAGAMSYARCIHPPGGATALVAVIGGADVHALGYVFVLTPVAINLLAIMLVAFSFNNLFPWRRYPMALMAAKHHAEPANLPGLTHEDLAAAMASLDTYIDITSEELASLFEHAWAHAEASHANPVQIEGGRFYSNGRSGSQWMIRQVIDLPDAQPSSGGKIIYKNVAGDQNYETGICRLEEFQQWARFEVKKDGDLWVKRIIEESNWFRASA